MLTASTSPKLGFALCLYLDKLSLHRATPRRFWLSKTDLKTALEAHNFEWKSYPLLWVKTQNKMEVLPGPLPDGRRFSGDEGLGSRLTGLLVRKHLRQSFSSWGRNRIRRSHRTASHAASDSPDASCGVRQRDRVCVPISVNVAE